MSRESFRKLDKAHHYRAQHQVKYLVSRPRFSVPENTLLLSILLLRMAIVGGETGQKQRLVKHLEVIGKLCTKKYTITIHDS